MGGCIWIIASALWSRVLRIRLVNELKCIRPDLDLDQELDNSNSNEESSGHSIFYVQLWAKVCYISFK